MSWVSALLCAVAGYALFTGGVQLIYVLVVGPEPDKGFPSQRLYIDALLVWPLLFADAFQEAIERSRARGRPLFNTLIWVAFMGLLPPLFYPTHNLVSIGIYILLIFCVPCVFIGISMHAEAKREEMAWCRC